MLLNRLFCPAAEVRAIWGVVSTKSVKLRAKVGRRAIRLSDTNWLAPVRDVERSGSATASTVTPPSRTAARRSVTSATRRWPSGSTTSGTRAVPRPRRVVKQRGVTRESAAGQGGTGPPTRGSPPPRDVHRNPQEDHAHVEPEEQWLRDEIVPQHEQRAQQEQRGDDRISPRAIASLHGGQAAPQHEHRRHRERIERPDPDDELVGELRELPHQHEPRAEASRQPDRSRRRARA